jgi:DNA-binding XRE family transcriptional regulator
MIPPKTLAEIRAQRTITPQMRDQIDGERELLSAEIALHALRERAGVSQSDAAQRLRVSRARVSAIERNGADLDIAPHTNR